MSDKARNNDIILILDESGSMETMGQEAAQSAKIFIQEQKDHSVLEDDASITIWKFNNRVRKVIDSYPLASKDEVSFTYNPEGGTAMYDALGQAITEKLSSSRSDNNICLILTDGLDNSSRKFKLSDAKKLIKDAENNHGWMFVFVGANIDAWSVGGSMGVGRCVNFEPTPLGLGTILRETSNSIARYRSGESDKVEL